MKIVSLNTLDAFAAEELLPFIERQAVDTDVFCFQEMTSTPDAVPATAGLVRRPNAVQLIASRLPGFRTFFAPVQDEVDWMPSAQGKVAFGNAMYVKEGLQIEAQGDFFITNGHNTYVPGDFETLGYNVIHATVRKGAATVTVCSFYGNSRPYDKLDTPGRLAQSEKLLAFLADKLGEKIVMGDFNLLPEAESIRMIERAGYRNLINEFSIKTTRGSFIKRLHPEFATGPYGFQEFADYAFVTPGVAVKAFEVPDLPVSDHLPLILTIAD